MELSAYAQVVKIHILESPPPRMSKQTVGLVLRWSCSATSAHTLGALRRFQSDWWPWSAALAVNASTKTLPSSLNQNLVLMRVPRLSFFLFQNCKLF